MELPATDGDCIPRARSSRVSGPRAWIVPEGEMHVVSICTAPTRHCCSNITEPCLSCHHRLAVTHLNILNVIIAGVPVVAVVDDNEPATATGYNSRGPAASR